MTSTKRRFKQRMAARCVFALGLLQLPTDLYARLASPTPQPLLHLRE